MCRPSRLLPELFQQTPLRGVFSIPGTVMTAELRSLPLRLLGKRHPRLADAMQFAAWYRVEHSILAKAIALKGGFVSQAPRLAA